MIKWVKKVLKEREIKKQKNVNLSNLKKELNELQKYLDHEGKMRGLCDYDEKDMKLFYSIQKKRDNKRKEIENYIESNNL